MSAYTIVYTGVFLVAIGLVIIIAMTFIRVPETYDRLRDRVLRVGIKSAIAAIVVGVLFVIGALKL